MFKDKVVLRFIIRLMKKACEEMLVLCRPFYIIEIILANFFFFKCQLSTYLQQGGLLPQLQGLCRHQGGEQEVKISLGQTGA